MAVYTDVPDDELRQFVAAYDLGEVVSCKGIAEGVENSNYLLRTERGTYILTLYEKRVDPKDLLEIALGPLASAETRQAVARAESKPQALTLLLMAPEFQRR